MSFVAESERLWLQPLSVSDHLQGYLNLNSDERVTRWGYRLPCTTLTEAEVIMRTRLPSEKQPWMENYAILLRPAPGQETTKLVMIGIIGIPRLVEGIDGVEVGYGIHPNFWGMGYATEALQLFIKHYWNSKRELQKETIKAYTEPENTSSQKVLVKVGFTRGELFGDVEVTNPHTGEKEMKTFYPWQLDRPRI